MTSSHRDYEKTIKNYVDVKFPGRFSSYREIQSATAFRNRMIEHGLWDCFIAWANARMDFQQAGDLENSNIYKILNVVSRRLLAFSLVQPQKKISDDVQEHKEYTWADLCMSALKFAIPCAKPLSADQWLIPFSLAKQSDLEKVEVFLAPMGSSKAAKLPETLKEAREKAAAKKLETEKKKKQKSKAKATAKAKAKATANEKKRPAEDTEQFAPTMVDALGCTRVTMFGDDILNAINYTLEKVNPKHHRPDVISKCLDMACLFALEGNLSAAGITGNTVWTKARQTIKTLLNRAHSLQARISDPDLPDKDMAKASSPQAGSSGASKPDGEQEQDQTEDDAAAAVKHFVSILKNTNEKLFTGFLEANFSEFTAGGGSDAEDEDEDEEIHVPTLAAVADSHPGVKLVINKLKKTIRTKVGNLKVGQSLNPHDFILEVVMTVHGVFDSSFIDVTNGMMAALQALGLGGNRGELAEDLLGVGLPSLQQHRKILKAISLSFGNNVSNAQTFVLHRTVYVLAAVNCLAEELNALRDKVKAKADKGTASPDLPQQLQETASAYAAGVTVLRSMIAEVAAVDIEFAETNCVTLENEEGKKKIMDMWACMWEKMLQGVTSLSHSGMERSPEQWVSLKEAEIKKLSKKNMKCLAAAIATDMAQYPVEVESEEVEELPFDFPQEIYGLWRRSRKQQQQSDGGDDAFDFEGEMLKLKKEILTFAAATLQIEIAKKQEVANQEAWKKHVSGILETCAGAAPGAGPTGQTGGFDFADQLPDFDRFPGGNTDKKLLVAHQAASLATSMILGAYSEKTESLINTSGLSEYHDATVRQLCVFKKKISFRLDDSDFSKTASASTDIAQSMFSKVKMCFMGRLVALAKGQPTSLLKSKVKVPSKFFHSLGCDLFVVPISKANPDMAIKSPLFCPAWAVKPKSKGATLKFDYMQATIADKFGLGAEIDLSMPILVPEDGTIECSNVKTCQADGTELRLFGFDLTRPFSAEEIGEGEEKQQAKEAKKEMTARRAAITEEDFDDGHAHLGQPDCQLSIPAGFLRHVLK